MTNDIDWHNQVLSLWGENLSAAPLPGEYDLNFKISGATSCVLKIMHAGCDHAYIDMQIALLNHLERSGVDVPSIIETSDGQSSIVIKDDEGAERIAWMISFLPGALLAETSPITVSLLSEMGRTLAKLNLAMRDFNHPALERTFKWDLKAAHWIADHIELLNSPDRQRTISKILDNYENIYGPLLESLPQQAIHNDVNNYNILVSSLNHEPLTCGLIDFGDALYAPVLADVAIASAYLVLGTDKPIENLVAFIEGYTSIRPLSSQEVDAIWPLLLTRLAVTVINCAIMKKERPDDPYVVVSEKPAWNLLDRFDEFDLTQIGLRLREAAGWLPMKTAQDQNTLLETRRKSLTAQNLKLSYVEPVHMVRGWKNYLFDSTGRQYLDAYNNVPHVGHAHPHITAAVTRQISRLNTNTRYLSTGLAEYAEALLERLPDEFDTCFFVNSGSEANEVAIRLARAYTGAYDVMVTEHGYHGVTQLCVDISHYKFAQNKCQVQQNWVHVANCPDPFRGVHLGPDCGSDYAKDLKTHLDELAKDGRRIAGFISEPLPSVGGQVIPPAGYLRQAYDAIRAHGGLTIADEVQTSLGRLGKFGWGFEQQDAVPDIVVLGKPVGNGYPLGVVVTRNKIATSFSEGMEFFSTFGGSNVSCAAGLAVLEVIEQENLAQNSQDVGDLLLKGLKDLQQQYSIFADVRGVGLFIGVDIADQNGKPHTSAASYIVNEMKDRGILIGSDGPFNNVLKIRPPLCFSKEDCLTLLKALADILVSSDFPS